MDQLSIYDKKGNLIITGKYCHGELCGKWKFNNYPRENVVAEIDYNFNPQNLLILDQKYGMPQRMAQFPGGDMEMRKYIYENLVIPYSGIRKGIEGRCLVRFAINEDGNTENIELIETCHKDYGKETLRLIKEMPKWTPAENNGVKTKVSLTLPVSFTLPK
jgi:protein TonB